MNENKEENVSSEQQSPQLLDSSKAIYQPVAQVIGEIKPEKQKGVFGVIIFFIILFGVVFGLPYIQQYLDEKNKVPEEEVVPTEEPKEENPEVTPEPEIVYYEISPEVEFTFDNLKFTTASKEKTDDYYFNITATNTSNKTVDLFSQNYYLELFTSEKTLLERVKVVDDNSLSGNSTLNLHLPISENTYNNAATITISQKTDVDYPEFEAINVEDDYKVVVCNNNSSSLKYYFMDNKLVKINDVYEYTNTDSEVYANELQDYTSKAARYNNIEGISSNIVETNNTFTFNTVIDLKEATIKDLNNKYYFAKNTEAKVVKFEMEAMRYTCN